MTTSIIKYALSNLTGKPVYIDVASNGLSCNCSCAKCGEKMVAVQGKSENHREWHFRHHIDSDCLGGQETAIHKLAKQIIVDNSQILIPNDTLIYSQARQEIKLGSFIPDVTVFANGHDIHFEIAVTNPVDKLKETFYKSGQHKSIEIDLTNISYDTTPNELEELVLKTSKRKKIFWEAATVTSNTQDKQHWWTNPLSVIGLIIGIAFIVFKGYKWLSDKNRR